MSDTTDKMFIERHPYLSFYVGGFILLALGLVAISFVSHKLRAMQNTPEYRCVINSQGSSKVFRDALKRRMKNPDGFQVVRASGAVQDNGMSLQVVTYRATNSFGAVITERAVGAIDLTNCRPTFL